MGRYCRLELVDDETEIKFINNRFRVPKALTENGGEIFQNWYIQTAKEKILPRVNLYAKKLSVRFNQAKITDSKYRWGSCIPQDNVNFNWRLIKAPMFVIDYVIVHELAHLIESNHTPQFWHIIRWQVASMERVKQ